MNPDSLAAIKELYFLWDPVYPFLSRHFGKIYGRGDGAVVEIGPFCGSVFWLAKERIGDSFLIATFPPGLGEFFREQRKKHDGGKVDVLESTPSLSGVPENRFDLAVFRGALFFPALFQVDFLAIHRILRPGGIAIIGGGFGKFTPDTIIHKIAERSRALNLRLGKREVDREKLEEILRKAAPGAETEVASEGGLWVIMKKERPSPCDAEKS